jgi:hypothetical protein
MSYRTLDPVLIIGTAERLEERIADRFPNSGLRKVAAGLVHLSRDLAKAAKELERPIWWVRILIGLAIAVGASVFLFVGTFLSFDRISTGAFDFVQGIEASLNTLLLAGLALQLRVLSISESMGDHDSEVMECQVHRSRRRWSSGHLRCGM